MADQKYDLTIYHTSGSITECLDSSFQKSPEDSIRTWLREKICILPSPTQEHYIPWEKIDKILVVKK